MHDALVKINTRVSHWQLKVIICVLLDAELVKCLGILKTKLFFLTDLSYSEAVLMTQQCLWPSEAVLMTQQCLWPNEAVLMTQQCLWPSEAVLMTQQCLWPSEAILMTQQCLWPSEAVLMTQQCLWPSEAVLMTQQCLWPSVLDDYKMAWTAETWLDREGIWLHDNARA